MLSVKGLEAAYGLSQVLFGISLEIGQGEVVALLGRNGAGKTTTLSSLIGLVPPKAGSIRFHDQEIAGAEPFRINRLGMGLVPENGRLFGTLTVAENLETARRPAPDGSVRFGVDEVVALFPDMAEFMSRRAGLLSGGQQRMVAIGRTLMGNPDLLLLDEPSEGLAPLVVEALLERLKRLRETGVTVLLSEQNLRFANELADRAYIIEQGAIRYEGTVADLARQPEVREKYLMV
ncbi:MAG: ABC transporter ATP-binding protein [Alphaproteobacteria bacterium]